MKKLDDLKNLLAFTSVSHLTEFRFVPPIDDNAKTRIKDAKHFFEDSLKGLKSIVKRRGPYYIVEDLNEILEYTGHYLKNKGAVQQEREIDQLVNEFENHIRRLDILEKDPRRFYSEETFKRKNLIYICRKMAEFYQRKAEGELLRAGETSDD